VEQESAAYGFLLHDVGKIGIPDNVLQKPGPLTTDERRLMQTHTVLGEQMLGGVAFLKGQGLLVVRSHHERWDGDGYPDGLGGEEIPLAARIFAVADTLDAMTSDRPYRRGGSWEEAGAEIVAQSGRQFDPAMVDAFREHEPALREICRRFEVAA
jgi:ribonuclease P protein subunit RPR2